MYTIQSRRLLVRIAEPGESPNNTHRFDRAGFITDLILDRQINYCASEPPDGITSGGRGFCSEFQGEQDMDAAAGEYFPKFGVGLIKKESADRYYFGTQYRDVKPFAVKAELFPDRAVFRTAPELCMGCALESEKTIRAAGNILEITTRVKNSGEKTIALREYCHNFISIGGMAVGEKYRVELPPLQNGAKWRALKYIGEEGVLICGERGLGFTRYSPKPVYMEAAMDALDPEDARRGEFTWTMKYGDMAQVKCVEHFTPADFHFWAMDHMVSPEMFHHFSIKPGESHEWKRTYTFEWLSDSSRWKQDNE